VTQRGRHTTTSHITAAKLTVSATGRLATKFVERILGGISAKDLPVENYSKVRLVLNLRSAQHVGVRIPPTMLLRSGRVIE